MSLLSDYSVGKLYVAHINTHICAYISLQTYVCELAQEITINAFVNKFPFNVFQDVTTDMNL